MQIVKTVGEDESSKAFEAKYRRVNLNQNIKEWIWFFAIPGTVPHKIMIRETIEYILYKYP